MLKFFLFFSNDKNNDKSSNNTKVTLGDARVNTDGNKNSTNNLNCC